MIVFSSVDLLQKLVNNVTPNAVQKVKSQYIRNYLNESGPTCTTMDICDLSKPRQASRN